MSVLTFTFPHLPLPYQTTTLALFPSLPPSTSSQLRSRLLAAPQGTPEERASLNYAFIDAKLITSERHLRTGLHQALLAVSKGQGGADGVEGGMRTKNAHSEVLFALHPSGNIGESIRKFGISATTTSLLLLRVGTSPATSQTILEEMRALISSSSSDEERSQELQVADLAREGSLDSYLAQLTSWKDVETVYKIGKDADGLYGQRRAVAGQGDNKAIEQEKEVARHEWADGVVTTIVAMKPVAA
ncbi:hypothetical protein A4X13_0g5423 [Tilletia indica]|uniref:EKC/KEOPS complex subunit CGI121 n=1 Tax=Tilletia indica TaxID=43049 RepID=A0A177TPI7_9BASI|nr:hypothetical protein A4X13_0g5423 [Tilletia indica]